MSRLVSDISIFLIDFRVWCRVLFSDWSISKMNITNLALDQSEHSTEPRCSVIIICGFVSISIGYLYFLKDFRVRCRVLFSDWSISKMNITNLALDQSERSTEYWRSVNLIFALHLPGGRTRTSDANLKVKLERFVF